MTDILRFAFKIISDSGGEFWMREPVRRPGADREKATCKLMLSLCAAFKQSDTMCNTEFNSLIVASFEMQSGNKFRRPPITSI